MQNVNKLFLGLYFEASTNNLSSHANNFFNLIKKLVENFSKTN